MQLSAPMSERPNQRRSSRPNLACIGALGAGVARRVGHRRGLDVVEDGRLAHPDMGHPAGTYYVVIEAQTLLDCDHAEAALGDISRVPDLAWERGWQQAEAPSGRWTLRLRIFPPESVAQSA